MKHHLELEKKKKQTPTTINFEERKHVAAIEAKKFIIQSFT